MKALVVRAFAGPDAIRLEDVPAPTPAAGEVLVRVHAVTVNRTRDLDVIAGRTSGLNLLPLVPGQDPAGEIAALGPDVEGRRVGERIIVSSRITCGACPACRSGHGSDCRTSIQIGIQRWGGYAEYVVVPERQALPIADSLSFGEAAVAMRHFPMAFQQLKAKAKLKSREWVLVMGAAGGLGSAVVQAAKHLGGRVIAGAGSPERVAAARALGAEFGIDYRRENLAERVDEITGGHGADVVCENISDPTTFPAAFAALAVGGRLVTSGAHGGGTVPVDMRQLYQKRQSIFGAAGSDRRDVEQAMAAAAKGKLRSAIERTLPLAQLHDAFELIGSRKVTGKIVIDPQM